MSNAVLQAPETFPLCTTELSADGKWELFTSLGEGGHGLAHPGDPRKFLVHKGVEFTKKGKVKVWHLAFARFDNRDEAVTFIAEQAR